ncbi:UNVERIFIED_CONTAM: hypothetical protein PYX00_007353 [Menopon gallinae]|uniref:Beta-lactamase-related domain-containing protein n=1 Tax=Menopon gallinae TaxID=328185 RepID=A0AAW2HIF8_9NEOP
MPDQHRNLLKLGRNFLSFVAGGALGWGSCYFYLNKFGPHKSGGYLIGNFEVSNQLLPKKCVSQAQGNKYDAVFQRCRELVKKFQHETGAPGVVVGVSVDGNVIWEEGFGYSDLEQGAHCHADTAMRIASISKPITMALLAKMWEDGKVDIDKPIHSYVSNFPIKKVDDEVVTITARQLASHTAGIRHYTKKGESQDKDSVSKEFYIKDKYESVENSLELFKNDDLLFKPGTSFVYTTHGYTLLSAVMEGAEKKSFKDMIQDLFKLFGMQNTYLDDVNTIIYNRSSYYSKNKKGRLINAELADTSYKWAGGGIVSTVGDLLKFGNAMLYCYQQTASDKSGYLKQKTVQEMWTPVEHSTMGWEKGAGYGLGWVVVPHRNDIGGLDTQNFYIGHGGGAVGASSILMIVPRPSSERAIPSGISVAVLTNLQDVSCHKLAKKIAQEFS